MATGTVATTARKFHHDLVHYVSAAITSDDVGGTVTIGKLPAGAAIVGGGVVVTTAFNGTTPVADLGISGDADDYASDLALGVAGTIVADALATAGNAYLDADTDVIATLAGTTVTAGAGYAYVQYIIANRGA